MKLNYRILSNSSSVCQSMTHAIPQSTLRHTLSIQQSRISSPLLRNSKVEYLHLVLHDPMIDHHLRTWQEVDCLMELDEEVEDVMDVELTVTT